MHASPRGGFSVAERRLQRVWASVAAAMGSVVPLGLYRTGSVVVEHGL